MKLKKSAMAEEKFVAVIPGDGDNGTSETTASCVCEGRMKSAKDAVEVI